MDCIGLVSGNDEPDKLERLALNTTRGDHVDAPMIDDCPVSAECKLISQVELGTHVWCVGEVVAVHVDESVILEGDRLDTSAIDPLVLALSTMEHVFMNNAG